MFELREKPKKKKPIYNTLLVFRFPLTFPEDQDYDSMSENKFIYKFIISYLRKETKHIR